MKKKLSELNLLLNTFVFQWYYKRVPEHFRQWTFIKSVDLLIQNYKHQQIELKGKDEVIAGAIKEETRLKNELSNLRIQIIASSQQIEILNKSFGTDFKPSSDN